MLYNNIHDNIHDNISMTDKHDYYCYCVICNHWEQYYVINALHSSITSESLSHPPSSWRVNGWPQQSDKLYHQAVIMRHTNRNRC